LYFEYAIAVSLVTAMLPHRQQPINAAISRGFPARAIDSGHKTAWPGSSTDRHETKTTAQTHNGESNCKVLAKCIRGMHAS
jgi:hypothetical protein